MTAERAGQVALVGTALLWTYLAVVLFPGDSVIGVPLRTPVWVVLLAASYVLIPYTFGRNIASESVNRGSTTFRGTEIQAGQREKLAAAARRQRATAAGRARLGNDTRGADLS